MKKMYLKQGSKEWLEWRSSGIGASDIATIMETNPYQTPLQLWQEKCGFAKPKFVNNAMIKGTLEEPIARRKINEDMNLNLKNICVEEEYNSWFMASLDGFDEEQRVPVEIKTPSNAKALEDAKNGVIPEMYKDQVQWQAMLTNPKRAMVCVWDADKKDYSIIPVTPDKDRQRQM